MTISTTAPYR